MSKEEQLATLKVYMSQLREWEKKSISELHAELGKLMDAKGELTDEQRGLLGIAQAVLEKYGLNKKIGGLEL